MAGDLTKQYSLDYLISSGSAANQAPKPAPSSPPAPANAPVETPAADRVFEVLSQPILRKLEAAPNHTMSVFQLIDQLSGTYDNLQSEAFAEIINRLVAVGRIKIVERHRHGDHKICKA